MRVWSSLPLLLVVLLAGRGAAWAGEQSWQQRLDRDSLVVGAEVSVSDPVTYDVLDVLRREVVVTLAYHRGLRTDLLTSGDWRLEVQFTAWNEGSTESFSDTLFVEYSPGTDVHTYSSSKWYKRPDFGPQVHVEVDRVRIEYDDGSISF